MDSLHVTDEASAAVATHPRVSLKDIEDAIWCRYDLTADRALAIVMQAAESEDRGAGGWSTNLNTLSLCFLVMKNGFVVIGKAAPASPENFNPEVGRQFAYEDAVRQLWPLMGFALRDRLAASA